MKGSSQVDKMRLYSHSKWFIFRGHFIGGLIWFAWHLPLSLIVPQAVEVPVWQGLLNIVVLAIGSVCTFTYLAYIYFRSESVWVTSVAHITMNNSAASFSYFVLVQNQILANLGLTLAMIIVVTILYSRKELALFERYFAAGFNQQS